MTTAEGGGRRVTLPAVMLWLFALAAAPLLLGTPPPLQDLPNHLASAYIAEHPAAYPALEVNGYLRSNSALALWLHLLGGPLGLVGAARLFLALVLAAAAASLAYLGWTVGGSRQLVTIALLAWPLVHHFFVSTGLLNFSLGLAGAWTALALALRRERRHRAPEAAPGEGSNPRGARGSWGWLESSAGIATPLAAWYAHPFPITLAAGLVMLEAIRDQPPGRWPRRALWSVVPFVPALLLSVATAVAHLLKPATRPVLSASEVRWSTPAETLKHLWDNGLVAFSWLEGTTLLVAVVLVVLGWQQRRRAVPFFGWPAMGLLLLGVFCLPSMGSNWGLLNVRFIPFFWVGLLLRAPPELPRWLRLTLPVAALAYGGGLWADYARLERERRAFSAAIPSVPEHASLLPLIFEARGSASFTQPLRHAWGYYVMAKQTSAPLLFAVERSYPLTYRTWPPPELIPPAVDELTDRLASPARACELEGLDPGDARQCLALWRERWEQFWRIATPAFDHVLTWGARPEFSTVLPPEYAPVFVQGPLALYARTPR